MNPPIVNDVTSPSESQRRTKSGDATADDEKIAVYIHCGMLAVSRLNESEALSPEP